MADHIPWPSAHQLMTEQEITDAIAAQAITINQQLGHQPLLVLCVMQGGLVYTGHLLPKLKMPIVLDTLRVTRYRNTTHGGEQVDWLTQPEASLKGQHVLLLDDIFDEGKTLEYLHAWAVAQGADHVYSAVMVNKIHTRKPKQYRTDFSAKDVPDQYVFGMGMDYCGAWRNASGIWALTNDHS
ncbi:hypoxanthine-guanine phosphoribosyltransferase [Marinagarivorans algicola]|uniref:hypoxanthine-guanine phosphoribosyltransferase n=1 Tax=Marinagarivorans algicola TaxID=1513270 RepID=UPI0006B68275|nr:hypoxanthine-guanine phosphoribosyltransferase [Marinagarivorans algicola]